MFRLLWIVFAAVASAAAAYFLTTIILNALLPLLTSAATQRDWLMAIEDTPLYLSTMASFFVFLFTCLGAGFTAIFDQRKLHNLHEEISQPQRGGPHIKSLVNGIDEDGVFYQAATAYTSSFKDISSPQDPDKTHTKTTASAEDYFSASQLARNSVRPLIYRFTAFLLLICGVTLFLNGWASPNAAPMPGLIQAVIALAIAILTSVFSWGLISVLLNWRLASLDRFCHMLNRQFQLNRFDLLDSSLEDIKAAIKDLSKETKNLQSEKSAQIDKVISTALTSFLDELRKVQNKELAGVEQRLKAVAEAAQALDRSYTDSLKQSSKTVASTLKDLKTTQSQSYTSLVKSQEKAANALKTAIEKNQKVVETAISSASKSLEKAALAQAEVAIKGLNPTIAELEKISGGMNKVLERMASGLETLNAQQVEISQSFHSEGSAAKVIETAATDMIAASKASRETVERFIALAERMRSITTTLKGVKGSNGKTPANRETAKKLSEALKDLSSHVEEGSGKDG